MTSSEIAEFEAEHKTALNITHVKELVMLPYCMVCLTGDVGTGGYQRFINAVKSRSEKRYRAALPYGSVEGLYTQSNHLPKWPKLPRRQTLSAVVSSDDTKKTFVFDNNKVSILMNTEIMNYKLGLGQEKSRELQEREQFCEIRREPTFRKWLDNLATGV